MYVFIVLLRAMAAMIITNAHYEEIYPIAIIANGGLLGDVLFFAVSGFCLYSLKVPFMSWYKKRLMRIYPTVWLITFIYSILGFYRINDIKNLIHFFLYPTYYHFVASILVLYMIYYILIYISTKFEKYQKNALEFILGSVIGIQFVYYLLVYNKSYYHIDSVYEPMIRFLFLEAMLIGAIVRKRSKEFVGNFKVQYVWLTGILFIGYFVSKLAFSRYVLLAKYQIVNQIILLLLLTAIMLMVAGLENSLKKMPQKVYKGVQYISTITLEIYLVQYVLIDNLNIGSFPVNFIIVSVGILLVASMLHIAIKQLERMIEKCISIVHK